MKSKVLKALHRFVKARRRKFVLWLRELLLDFEDRHKETKWGNNILRRYFGVAIGKNTIIDSCLQIGDNVVIGNNVLVRENCFIDSNVVIEDNVTLSPGVRLITAGHNPKDMSYVSAPIVIHKGAWIATNAILLPGAEIGEGACVAAGAVVRTGGVVPPYVLVAGVPAKVVKSLRENR